MLRPSTHYEYFQRCHRQGFRVFNSTTGEQALGGVDLVKDDEILFDNPLTPFEAANYTGKEVLQQVYEETGHRTLYAVNLSGRTSELRSKQKGQGSLEQMHSYLMFIHTV